MVSESQLASLYPSSASAAPAAPPAPAPKSTPVQQQSGNRELTVKTNEGNDNGRNTDSGTGRGRTDWSGDDNGGDDNQRRGFQSSDEDGEGAGEQGTDGEPGTSKEVKPADVLLKNGAVEVSKELADFRNTQERKMYGTDPAIKENTEVKGYIDALGKHGIDEAGARSINTEVRALAGDLGLGRSEIAELKQSMGKEATAERVSNWQQSSITELNRYGQNAGKVLAEAKRIASLSPVSRTLMQDKRLGNSPVIAKALFKRAAANLGVSAK